MTSAQLQVSGNPIPTHLPQHVYRFGKFELDTRSGELRRNGFRVRIQEQPRCILVLLLEHAGDLVPREEFHRALWPADTFVDFDIGLNAAMRKLRIALGDRVKNPHFIETVSRRGYRFSSPVAMFEMDPSQPPSQLFPAGVWLNAMETVQGQTPNP
jgi:DNA-binding winged helix-turn-helix (wHTH) protein